MTASEWLGGKTAGPKLVSLAGGYVAPTVKKEFVSEAPAEEKAAAIPSSDKEVRVQ